VLPNNSDYVNIELLEMRPTKEDKIEAFIGVLCSTFISGYVSAHNQLSIEARNKQLDEEEANKLVALAKVSVESFVTKHLQNPTNKEILEEVLEIPIKDIKFPIFEKPKDDN
jgi:hypothetical protein